mgnify:FL=1
MKMEEMCVRIEQNTSRSEGTASRVLALEDFRRNLDCISRNHFLETVASLRNEILEETTKAFDSANALDLRVDV